MYLNDVFYREVVNIYVYICFIVYFINIHERETITKIRIFNIIFLTK